MKLGKQTIVFLAVNKNGDEVIGDGRTRSAHDDDRRGSQLGDRTSKRYYP